MKIARVIWVMVALVVAAGTAFAGEARRLPAEAQKVAEEFVYAFAQNDRPKITTLLPTKARYRYGPSPFTKMPTLTKPRADGSAGAVEFAGGRGDTGLPDKGMIVLRRVREANGQTGWQIRQIYWYDELPKDAQVPDKSPSEKDKKEEPKIEAATTRFLKDWIGGEYDKLDGQVFHWWEIQRKPPKWIKMSSVMFKDPVPSLGGYRVEFVAKLKVLGAIPKTVNGTLWLVEEDGKWRVRPLTMAFSF